MASKGYEHDTSSDDEGTRTHRAKRRKGPKACDVCRRKKIRCDPDPSGDTQSPCVNCAVFKTDCTYTYIAKKRRTQQAYIESLQNRLSRAEKLLSTLAPNIDLSKELDNDSEISQLLSNSAQRHPRPPSPPQPVPIPDPNMNPGQVYTALTEWRDNPSSDDDDDDEGAFIPLPSAAMEGHPNHSILHRFHGKSSGVVLIKKVIGMKRDHVGTDETGLLPKDLAADPWEASISHGLPVVTFNFPPMDLLERLIDIFFCRVNLYLPLLHRSSFEVSIRDGLHNRDSSFGAVVLLLCAVSSRWSEDPRVLPQSPPDADTKPSWSSAGWDYYFQVHMRYRRNLLHATSVLDLQMFALGCIYLQGTMNNSPSWQMAGLGVRLALEVGAHRRKRPESSCKVETELWKRAFWVLVVMDRLGSAALGRPCAIWEEDIDLELLLEIDDEYLTEEFGFKQPPGKPSRIACFNSLVKLTQVLIGALRTIYPISKSKSLSRIVGSGWEQDMVAALDSSLNGWIDNIPEHLRWDPNREQPDFAFSQTVLLHCLYAYVQIVVHRPYITSSGKPSPLAFPSLAICTNAARSCSHILDAHMRRKCDPIPMLNHCAFTSAIVLLYNIWGTNKPGARMDWQSQVQDVHTCMRFIRKSEDRWGHAMKLGGILHDLVSVGEFPLPQASPPAYPGGQKRARDSDDALDSAHSTTPAATTSTTSESVDTQTPFMPVLGDNFNEHTQFKQEPLGFDDQSFVRPGVSPGGFLGRPSSQNLHQSQGQMPAAIPIQQGGLPYPYSFMQQQPDLRVDDIQGAHDVLSALESAYIDNTANMGDGVVMDIAQTSLDVWGSAPNGFQWDEWQQLNNMVQGGSAAGYARDQTDAWSQF